MALIYILPIETEPDPWIEQLEKSILRTFGHFSKLYKTDISLEKTFDMKRMQYNSSQILLQMLNNPPDQSSKMLGIVNVDLFIPVLTYVFGEAQLKGRSSIVSLRRLDNRFYGLPENRALLTERLIKEAIHELGHNFGLIHCGDHNCVMRSSTYVEDIDYKSLEMCDSCLMQLKSV